MTASETYPLRYELARAGELESLLKLDRLKVSPNVPSVGFIVRCGGSVAGFALAVNGEPGVYELLTIYTVPAWRGRGIGSELLRRVCEYLRTAGCSILFIKYNDSRHSVGKVKEFFRKNGMAEASADYVSFRVPYAEWKNHFEDTFGPLSAEAEPEWHVKHYPSLTAADITEITKASEHLPEFLRPFRKFMPASEPLSLFVYRTGKLCGWTIAHMKTGGLLSVDVTFVLPEYRKDGAGLLTWHYLYRRVDELGLNAEVRHIMFCFDERNPVLNRFFRLVCRDMEFHETRHYIARAEIK